MTQGLAPSSLALLMHGSKDLGLKRFGFRFAESETERRYQSWASERRVPLIRVGMVASVAGYAVYLATVFLLEPSSFAEVWPAALAFIGMLFGIYIATYIHRLRASLVPVIVIANCLSGLLLAWQIHELIDTPDRFELAATAVLIPVMFGYCVYRLSPVLASVSTLPFIALSMTFLYQDYRAGLISLATAGSFAAMQFIACNTGVFVSWVIEINNRRTFRKDQIIERQSLELEQSRDAIRRYVPPSVADMIISGRTGSIDKPVRQRVTILFADMVGFTEVSDRLEPEDLTDLLIDYLSGMAEKAEEFGGTLNEFAGDGVMVMFGAPIPMAVEQQALRAIAAAREMHALMSRLNRQWQLRGLGVGRELKIRVGINTGTASVGSFGSRGRMTYTAMGLQTNIASRIEKAAEPGCTLISNSTWRLAEGHVDCRPRGEVQCRGVHHPVRVYAVDPAVPRGD